MVSVLSGSTDATPFVERRQRLERSVEGLDTRQQFEKLFKESVERALGSVLSESCAKAVLYHMERNLWEKTYSEPELFAEALERLFGSGAHVLERQVLEVMYSQIGLTFAEREGCRFEDYVNECRKAWIILSHSK